MLHCKCLTGFLICLGFWVSQGSEYTSALNMPGLYICLWFQGSEYAGVTQCFEYAWIFSRHAFYVNLSKVILPLRKDFWTSVKLSHKVENCHAIVKRFLPVAGFLARFAHVSSQCNFFTLIWGLLWTLPIDQRYNMLETLEIQF